MSSLFFVPKCLVFKGRAATTFVFLKMMFAGIGGLFTVLASYLSRSEVGAVQTSGNG